MLVGQRNIYIRPTKENSLKRRLVGIAEDCQPGWRNHPVQAHASRFIHDNLTGMKLRDMNLKLTDSGLASPMRLSRRILAPLAPVLSALSGGSELDVRTAT